MKITKQQLFKSMLEQFGINTKILETKNYIKSGKYKYYKNEDIIVKESVEVEFIGGKYEKVKKLIIFIVERTLGIIKLVNKETKSVVINFKHKTEPLFLV